MYHPEMRVFGFMLNFLKNIIMSFTTNNLVIENRQSENIQKPLSSNQLTTKEIEVLLSMVKRSNFLGEDIEPLYNLVIKLQNQYIEQTK